MRSHSDYGRMLRIDRPSCLFPIVAQIIEVSLDVMNLKAIDSPEHSLLARCCLAALWRARFACHICSLEKACPAGRLRM